MPDIGSEIEKLAAKIKNAPVPEKLRDQAPVKKEPVCPICNGVRFLRKDVERNHPEFGKIFPCECSSNDIYAQYANIPMNEIDTLDWSKVEDVGEALKAARTVREVMERGYGWVYLWGGPGIAKSLILQIAVAMCVKNKQRATYISMSEILDDLRAGYDTDYPNMEAINRLKRWTGIPVLAIDEFDKVKGTEYITERRMRLMDERYVTATRQESVTLIASNDPPQAFDGYIADRILDGRFYMVELTGKSMRPAMSYPMDFD